MQDYALVNPPHSKIWPIPCYDFSVRSYYARQAQYIASHGAQVRSDRFRGLGLLIHKSKKSQPLALTCH